MDAIIDIKKKPKKQTNDLLKGVKKLPPIAKKAINRARVKKLATETNRHIPIKKTKDSDLPVFTLKVPKEYPKMSKVKDNPKIDMAQTKLKIPGQTKRISALEKKINDRIERDIASGLKKKDYDILEKNFGTRDINEVVKMMYVPPKVYTEEEKNNMRQQAQDLLKYFQDSDSDD